MYISTPWKFEVEIIRRTSFARLLCKYKHEQPWIGLLLYVRDPKIVALNEVLARAYDWHHRRSLEAFNYFSAPFNNSNNGRDTLSI